MAILWIFLTVTIGWILDMTQDSSLSYAAIGFFVGLLPGLIAKVPEKKM